MSQFYHLFRYQQAPIIREDNFLPCFVWPISRGRIFKTWTLAAYSERTHYLRPRPLRVPPRTVQNWQTLVQDRLMFFLMSRCPYQTWCILPLSATASTISGNFYPGQPNHSSDCSEEVDITDRDIYQSHSKHSAFLTYSHHISGAIDDYIYISHVDAER